MRAAARIVLAALLAASLLAAGNAGAEPQEFVILFGTGASRLTPEAQAIVTLIASRAGTQHPAAIDIAGYGDSDTGDDAALAAARAAAVMHALTDAGVAPGLIKKVPPAPPATATGIPVHKVTVTFE
ncbi:MAG: OmpA family protein [Stellaceae bacterium]